MRYQVFYLNQDPLECAKEYTDEHVKLMCLRLAEVFSFVYRKTNRFGEFADKLYWLHYLNRDHDLFYRWILRSNDNYMWTFNHLRALLDEHQYRFDRPHPCASIAEALKSWKPPEMASGDPPFSAPPYEEDLKYARDHNKKPLKSGDDFSKVSALNSYRAWYMAEGFCFTASFTKRPVPVWSIIPRTPLIAGSVPRPPRPSSLTSAQRRHAEHILGLANGR